MGGLRHRALRAIVFILLVLPGAAGCATTAVYQRERLADPAMARSSNETLLYLRAKIETAREGGLGRSDDVIAGGCGCQ